MKSLALMALLGGAMAAPCAGDAVTESDCTREINTSGVKFTYWVDMVGPVPTFHGNYDI